MLNQKLILLNSLNEEMKKYTQLQVTKIEDQKRKLISYEENTKNEIEKLTNGNQDST